MVCRHYSSIRVRRQQQKDGRTATIAPFVTRHYCEHAASKFTKEMAERFVLTGLKCRGGMDGCNVDDGSGYEE